MSVELYEGCYGVTAGGEIEGKFSARWEKPGLEWGVQRIDRMWSVAGVRFPRAYEPETDIIAVFPAREAAEAHLRGEKPIKLDPAGEVIMAALGIIKDAKPVTWLPGVHCVKIGPHTVTLSPIKPEIQVDCPGLGGASPSEARQISRADCRGCGLHREGRGMSAFRRRLIRLVFRGIIRQGPRLEDDLAEAFAEIRKVWADEFTEDNWFTQLGHIAEIFKRSERLR